MVTSNPRWDFYSINPSGDPAASGDLTDTIRQWAPEEPGIFADNAPSPEATLIAREALQNSWDSATERQKDDPEAAPFKVEFRFISVE